MDEVSLIAKVIEGAGTTGLILLVAWKLADKWGGQFLAAQNKQASAMGDLAAAVREGQGEQREILIALRVLATKVEETKAWVKELRTAEKDC